MVRKLNKRQVEQLLAQQAPAARKAAKRSTAENHAEKKQVTAAGKKRSVKKRARTRAGKAPATK